MTPLNNNQGNSSLNNCCVVTKKKTPGLFKKCINTSLEYGKIPNKLKIAKITSVFDDDKDNFK